MTTPRSKPYQASFALTASDEESQTSTPLGIRNSRRAAVRMQRLQPGDTIIVHPACAAVLVQTIAASSNTALIKSDDGETEVLKDAGEACSSGPGSVIVADPIAGRGLVLYEIPRASFRMFASLHASPPIDAFAIPTPVTDNFLRLLSRSVDPLLASNTVWSTDFARYFTMSLYLHLLERYGTHSSVRERSLGGLSPRNKLIVEETLRASNGAKISVDTLSGLCQLSSRQFARAFQQSFGMPFYKFQLDMRIQRAKLLLVETNTSLGEIAFELGYADQATFTEAFARVVAMPPGRFRRRHQPSTGVLSASS